MAKLSQRVLEAVGFRKQEIEPGITTHTLTIGRGWYLEYSDRLDLVRDGQSVPLRCRDREHLETLIKVL